MNDIPPFTRDWSVEKGRGWTLKIHRTYAGNVYGYSILVLYNDMIKQNYTDTSLVEERFLEGQDAALLDRADILFNDFLLSLAPSH